jgi:hypothetical protein
MKVTIGKWNSAGPGKKSDASKNKNKKKECKPKLKSKIPTGQEKNEEI